MFNFHHHLRLIVDIVVLASFQADLEGQDVLVVGRDLDVDFVAGGGLGGLVVRLLGLADQRLESLLAGGRHNGFSCNDLWS